MVPALYVHFVLWIIQALYNGELARKCSSACRLAVTDMQS